MAFTNLESPFHLRRRIRSLTASAQVMKDLERLRFEAHKTLMDIYNINLDNSSEGQLVELYTLVWTWCDTHRDDLYKLKLKLESFNYGQLTKTIESLSDLDDEGCLILHTLYGFKSTNSEKPTTENIWFGGKTLAYWASKDELEVKILLDDFLSSIFHRTLRIWNGVFWNFIYSND